MFFVCTCDFAPKLIPLSPLLQARRGGARSDPAAQLLQNTHHRMVREPARMSSGSLMLFCTSISHCQGIGCWVETLRAVASLTVSQMCAGKFGLADVWKDDSIEQGIWARRMGDIHDTHLRQHECSCTKYDTGRLTLQMKYVLSEPKVLLRILTRVCYFLNQYHMSPRVSMAESTPS